MGGGSTKSNFKGSENLHLIKCGPKVAHFIKTEQFSAGKSKDNIMQGMTGGELSSHILLEDMG